MVFCNSSTHLPCQKALYVFLLSTTTIILSFFLPSSYSLYFNFPQFGPNMSNITYYGDAFPSNRAIELTVPVNGSAVNGSTGRAIYSKPVHLWDSETGRLTDFTTHFSFIMNSLNKSTSGGGDGLAFFLAANGSYIPPASAGGQIGLFSSDSSLNSIENQLVAVEFDSYMNEWDPSADHIGINVNSIVSKANVTWRSSIKNGSTANAWVSYNSSTKNLSVFLTYAQNPDFGGNSSLYYLVDLREMLPEWIHIGFSAATRTLLETHHQILSWNFISTLEEVTVGGEQPKKENNKRGTGFVVGMVVGGAVLIIGLGSLLWFGLRRSVRFTEDVDEDELPHVPKFTYNQLVLATNNFSADGKLGEGSFGSVYKGFFSELNLKGAVKMVSGGSKKGKKEYISWVKIISRLHHRNLVRLLGWCHERGHFLLVYEFMANGSLASRLFGGKSLLPWALRYKIAEGLASSLEYLHEWEPCVVHGDIKSSNVMLDSDFNAKLGDFYLARLVDDGLGSETRPVVGTLGYLAPEYFFAGMKSKESDVYSFGVVALEIACGRRPVELEADGRMFNMLEWVWELYGRGNLLDAADQRLNNEFDEEQMERLMVLGLWCAHPDLNLRPSMIQVISVLKWEAPLPSLPSSMPLFTYPSPLLSDTIDTSSNSTAASSSSATDSLHSRQTDM